MVWLFTHAGHQGAGAHLGNEHKTCYPLLGLRDRKTAAIKQEQDRCVCVCVSWAKSKSYLLVVPGGKGSFFILLANMTSLVE